MSGKPAIKDENTPTVNQPTSQNKRYKTNMKTEIKRPGIKHMRSVVETILKVIFRRRRGEFVADMTSSRQSIQHLHRFVRVLFV
jgi:hypothetical protein